MVIEYVNFDNVHFQFSVLSFLKLLSQKWLCILYVYFFVVIPIPIFYCDIRIAEQKLHK